MTKEEFDICIGRKIRHRSWNYADYIIPTKINKKDIYYTKFKIHSASYSLFISGLKFLIIGSHEDWVLIKTELELLIENANAGRKYADKLLSEYADKIKIENGVYKAKE